MIGVIFCITLLISAITGGNMFQAWNVGEVTEDLLRCARGIDHRHHPRDRRGSWSSSVVSSRIGAVAGRLVPLMVIAVPDRRPSYVLILNIGQLPGPAQD